MNVPRDPHNIDLEIPFASLPPESRQEMRDFLEDYCSIALEIFERLERERGEFDEQIGTS